MGMINKLMNLLYNFSKNTDRIKKKRNNIDMDIYHFYCAYGGSGSTYLLNQLGAFARPDVLWQPSFKGRKLIEWKDYNRNNYLLGPEEYSTKLVDWSQFNIRTDYIFKSNIIKKESIEVNLIKFCKWIETTNYKVLFGNAAVVNFFSRNAIKNVTYLIRHPLHAYVSFSKEIRHGKQIKLFGDINSKKAIEFWADRWNRLTQDYLSSKLLNLNPILIRYEFVEYDKLVTEYHNELFKGFISSKRNNSILSQKSESYLKSLVSKNYFQLYDKWDI